MKNGRLAWGGGQSGDSPSLGIWFEDETCVGRGTYEDEFMKRRHFLSGSLALSAGSASLVLGQTSAVDSLWVDYAVKLKVAMENHAGDMHSLELKSLVLE